MRHATEHEFAGTIRSARVHLAREEAVAALARLQEAASGRDHWITFHRLTAPAADPRVDAFLKSLGM